MYLCSQKLKVIDSNRVQAMSTFMSTFSYPYIEIFLRIFEAIIIFLLMVNLILHFPAVYRERLTNLKCDLMTATNHVTSSKESIKVIKWVPNGPKDEI